MEIKKKYYSKYLHTIAIEQIAEEYIQRGFNITKEEKIGKYSADIIARKENEQIVIEVKTGHFTPERRKDLANLADYIRSLGGYKFIVAIATPPKEKKLEIDNLEQLLTMEMLFDMPSELDELSTHTRPEEVVDVDIDEILIQESFILVKGTGTVIVELQFGSDSDQNDDMGLNSKDKFPFEFEVTLVYKDNKKLVIENVEKFEIDTSSYYD